MPESIRHRRGYSDPFADLAQPRKEQDDFSQNDSASSMFEKVRHYMVRGLRSMVVEGSIFTRYVGS